MLGGERRTSGEGKKNLRSGTNAKVCGKSYRNKRMREFLLLKTPKVFNKDKKFLRPFLHYSDQVTTNYIYALVQFATFV